MIGASRRGHPGGTLRPAAAAVTALLVGACATSPTGAPSS